MIWSLIVLVVGWYLTKQGSKFVSVAIKDITNRIMR